MDDIGVVVGDGSSCVVGVYGDDISCNDGENYMIFGNWGL